MRSRSGRPVLAISLLSLGLAACNGSDGNGNGSMPGGHTSQNTAAQQSTNWSGYVHEGAGFNRVSGSWVVPKVACGGNDGTASSTWTGIGGFAQTDPSLVQAGTGQDCSGGATYYAWWETLPAPSVNAGDGPLDMQSFPVQPGDHITVTIDGSSLVVWSISIQNTTAGWTFNQTVPYVSGSSSVEWIEEAPLAFGAGGAGQADLAHYGQVSFSSLTANGASVALTADESLAMVDGSGAVISNPSAPKGSGDAFDVCFGSASCP